LRKSERLHHPTDHASAVYRTFEMTYVLMMRGTFIYTRCSFWETKPEFFFSLFHGRIRIMLLYLLIRLDKQVISGPCEIKINIFEGK
jgi:hypothetical protein